MERRTVPSYVGFGYPAEPDIRAILNDRVAGAAEIDIDVFAVVHTELPARDHDHAMLDRSDMGRAIHLPTYQEALLDIINGQAGIGFPVGGGNGHVNNAVAQEGD